MPDDVRNSSNPRKSRPGLTLWASVVAERLGYPPDTALTLGRSAQDEHGGC